MTKGKVTAGVSPAAVTLNRADAASFADVKITIADAAVAPVVNVTAGSKAFSAEYLGEGAVRIGFKDGKVPKKGETVKLSVFVEGCPEAAATVKVTVKLTGTGAVEGAESELLPEETPESVSEPVREEILPDYDSDWYSEPEEEPAQGSDWF
ncbi:MAG: hypothetical protein IKE30_05905 [Clostridia bacterium]|nr:hypothetical protein [Clostridia bacterium]